jgi:hypothetical protein
MKSPRVRANRLTIRRAIAAYTNDSPVAHNFSKSLLIRRLWEIHAKDRSTIHLMRNNDLGPFSGRGFFQSTITPFLTHSLAHILITSCGASFRGWRTISALHPRVPSAPIPHPSLDLCKLRLATRKRVLGNCPSLPTEQGLDAVPIHQPCALCTLALSTNP